MPASREKALQSIARAEELFSEAKAGLQDGRINSCVIVAYMALFHAGRALLFRDGYREKSHECIVRYLEETYGKELGSKTVERLDLFKAERMHTQYDITYKPNEENAEAMLEFVGEFITIIKELI